MDRRNFLRLLLGGAAGLVAPTKTYSFLGSIFRGKAPLPPTRILTATEIWARERDIARHLRAMQDAMIQSMLYGMSPPPFSGLAARYSSINAGVKAGVEAGDWDNIVRIS